MERSEPGLKKYKGNEVKHVNPKILRCSCLSGIEDGDFSEWLLVEVLLRLPVKSVFRFKLVSRKWLSIISDPYFVRSYMSRASLLSQQSWTILPFHMHIKDSESSHLDYGLLKDLDLRPSLCIVHVPSIHTPKEENYLIFGVSNRLVFYGTYTGLQVDYVDHSYYICNPLTGHSIVLPPVTCRFCFCGWGFLTHVEDGFLKSYRVVRVEPPIQESNSIRFRVFVSEVGEWKDFNVSSNYFPLYLDLPATTLNGVLHWIASGHGIIAYDPYQNPETMRVIAFPSDILNIQRQNEFNSLCVEYRGKLRYFEVGNLTISGIAFPRFRIWVLNDYSSGDWCLQHTISHLDVQYNANFPGRRFSVEPICFHPFDSDIVYLGCGGVCISYNIKTRKLQVEDEFFRNTGNVFQKRRVSWWLHSFLFVIPHWPVSMEG